ncbi:ketoacyl-ACP synthase III [Dactylosporangium aurantiacum]|uniref:Beta-ketoacyl-[acyl-carrier-protein] synthase III n=1 Tax=Dactylosporangium aurantiacum TaxID=35754 RepID=A0A9Q9IA87_9ACTN|nr:beta-ketoacyl-ACP synthase III [Dactylosporangium aurantiacum]MDG6106917.1 ketoacyl-ACP synthase III [Dactylosporangium aurantiacum]UWZ50720.1 ketoacyl-ACP synthase III [Dactylosporangium aurantiacum]
MSPTAVLTGIGGYVPPRRVTNEELAQSLGTNDEWIRSRTGIQQRHWADAGTVTGDLAAEAGERALKSAGVRDVDLVVLATSTGNQPMPATAPEVAANLGLGQVAAYDVSAACAGFVYALTAAAGAIAIGAAERVLVIGADLWSTRLDPADRSTAIIFGDGAGAAVLRAGTAGEAGSLLGFDAGSDGDRRALAVVPGGGSRQRSHPHAPELANEYLTMRGRDLFTQAVEHMAGSSQRLLGRVGWTGADVDWCVAHQANIRILHTVADVLRMPRERMLSNVDHVGNTSAASIPLLLSEATADGRLEAGDRVVLTAFGGGLSWASTALIWPDL